MQTDFIYEKTSFFAAANSFRGFVSFFGDIFSRSELERLYVIKGGSGTGKSRLMRELAGEAEARGERVEYFYCSSDPRSLDGIILCERRLGVVDGTAPHTLELSLPGAFDEIVDLGAFWDSEVLREHKREIELLCDEKKRLYMRAYSYLSAAGEVERCAIESTFRSLRREKLIAWAQRFSRRFEPSRSPETRVRLTSALCCEGKVHVRGFISQATEVYKLVDRAHAVGAVLDVLHDALSARGVSHTLSRDPLDTSRLDALYIDGADVCVMQTDGSELERPAVVINTERFIEAADRSALRAEIRSAERLSSCLCESAFAEMRRVAALHAELEHIYSGAMDFTAKEAFTASLKKRIFD